MRADGVLRLALPALPIAALGLALLMADGLAAEARAALFAFGLAVILWTMTAASAAQVALGAALLVVLTGAVPQERLLGALGAEVVWLMIGAFMLGGALRESGLAARLTGLFARRTQSVGQMFWLTTAALLPLSLLIPSTSARAAIALPMITTLGAAARDAQVTRALMLLAPTIILVSTICSLIGAGSHLVANQLLADMTGRRIGFGEWLLYGLPFGLAASACACFVVQRMFLDGASRARRLAVPAEPGGPLRRAERVTLWAAGGMVALWLTGAWHGLAPASVALLGAFCLTLPRVGALRWKAALSAVSWDLVIFVAAALVLGEALMETGAAAWIFARVAGLVGLEGGGAVTGWLVGLSLLSLTAHLYMTSHVARAAALVPPLLLLAQQGGRDPAAVMFLATVGMNYCLTFPVSSKALLMFQGTEEAGWRPRDLLRLSAVLLPLHLVLMLGFYHGWWRWVGLAL